MLLVVTNSTDETSDYLCTRLTRSGADLVRLDSDRIVQDATISHADRTRLNLKGRDIEVSDVTNVWLRRPEKISCRVSDDVAINKHAEDEWTAAVEGFLTQIPVHLWMNHPSANAAASHKIEQLVRARRLGLQAPESLVTQSPQDAQDFFDRLGGDVIVKPVNHGRISREGGADDLIFTSAVSLQNAARFDEVRSCPTLLQKRIDKAFDVRLTVVDGTVSATRIDSSENSGRQILDVRRDNMTGAMYSEIVVPTDVMAGIVGLVRSYSLRFAAVDFGVTSDGRWVFFEVNPNGQWAWLDLLGGQELHLMFAAAFS